MIKESIGKAIVEAIWMVIIVACCASVPVILIKILEATA